VILALSLACRPAPPPRSEEGWPEYDVLAYVDPTIATGGQGAQVTGLNPGAAWPLGQVLVGPDTRSTVLGQPVFLHYGGYHADDDRIDGFSHTHGSGMGVVDYGAVHVTPRARWRAGFETAAGRAAPFRDEEASAGRYAVTFDDDGTRVEIVASAHGAHHRWTFPADAEPVALFDLLHALPGVEVGDDATVAIDPDGTVTGYQRVSGGYSSRFGGIRTWFRGRLSPAPAAVEPFEGEDSAGLRVTFPAGTEAVELRLAISVVDAEGAAANLAAELGDGTFEDHRAAAEAAWRGWLEPARIWGGDDEEAARRTFHTAHYRTALMPREYRDVDGRYRGLDQEIHTADFRYLSDLSLWDTYRTTHPWYALVHPDAQADAARSLVRMAEDGGSLPRWPMAHGYTGGMVGSPATIVLAETAIKGVGGFDEAQALAFTAAQSDGPTEPVGRAHVEAWLDAEYVPGDRGGSVSLTVEYAWADHAGAALARHLGQDDVAARLSARSGWWANVFDPAVGFAHGRAADGAFLPFESPTAWTDDYVEGNAWHYLWQSPYDVPGLIEVHHDGDADAFADRLAAYWDDVRAEPDDLLPDDYYWHGNEPVMHYAWLGSLAGRPDVTVAAVDWVARNRYSDTEEGLDGNDDAGTLSAWYLWAALGLYPIAGTDTYALAAPRVAHAEIETVGGLLSIDGPGDGGALPSRITLDGRPLAGATVTHDELLGASLSFED
jgi:predicted alpha-1,2-mannosidase